MAGTMAALRFARSGSLDALELVELPRPVPADGEALIEVRAAGLNPSDVKNVLGRFAQTTLPRIPGRDFAGIVRAGPAEWIGRAVWGSGAEFGFVRDGSHAGWLCVPVEALATKPDVLDFAAAAACPVPYLTALEALDRCAVDAGTRVLVIGAAGAVGAAASSLARARGAQVIAAVRQTAQAEQLRATGLDTIHLADAPATPDSGLPAAVRARFGDGADMVLDTTGHWLEDAVHSLATGGRVAVISARADGMATLPLLALYRRGGSVIGVNSLLLDGAASALRLTRIAQAFDSGQLQPPPAPETRALSAGRVAYLDVDAGRAGKLVLLPEPA